MTRRILCLSGWGQKFDSLEFIFSDQVFAPFFVESLDYSRFGAVEDFFDFVKTKFGASNHAATQLVDGPEIMVGWSLGGQLAIRLIAAKILKPKLLILIAPPFQLVKDARIQAGMGQSAFKKFRDDFVLAPDKTLKQFAILTSMNDRNAAAIARGLDVNDANFTQLTFWLDELARFSCFDVDFSAMPKTLYFHGAGDMIVPVSQAQYFKERIADFHAEIFMQCGHAPQLNDVESLRRMMVDYINI